MYTIIVFNAYDAWGKHVYSFKINMLSRELHVEYSNNTGGVTTNGVCLSKKQYQHIKLLSTPTVFEKFRDGSWEDTTFFVTDPRGWEAQFISDDGTPMLVMKSIGHTFPPPALEELVDYVMSIGTLGNMSRKLF